MNSIINGLSNNVVTLDLDNKYRDMVINNKNILNIFELGGSGNGKSFSFFKKSLDVDKYNKYFKRKDINYFIGEVSNVLKYKKTLVKDILTTTCDKVYIYSKNKNSLQVLEHIVKRYTKDYEIKKIDRDYILIISCKKVRSNFLINKLYYIKDMFTEFFDFISNILLK